MVRASSAQRRLFFLWSLDPDSAVYNVPGALSVRGGLDTKQLDAALGALQWRHESLRTTFEERDGDVVQRVHGIEACHRVRADVTDARGATRGEREDWALAEIRRLGAVPFSLTAGPLWRCHVIEVAPDAHLVAFAFHHIVMDEVSSSVFSRELDLAYADPLVFLDAPAAPQYADHCAAPESQPGYADGLAYWKGRLTGIEATALPEDGAPDESDAAGDSVPLTLDEDGVRALEELCARQGAGAFPGFLAAYLVLLHRWTGMTDVVVGIPVAGRSDPASYGVIGFFSNTVVVRCEITPDLTFEDVLARTGDAVYDALEFQEIPFDAVVDAVQPDREPGRNPLFRMSMVYETADLADTWGLAGLDVTEVPVELDVSHFDLTLGLRRGNLTTGEITYSTRRFSRPAMDRMAAGYATLLRHLCQNPGTPVGDLELLSAAEREQVLRLGEGPAVGRADAGGPQTVWELFETTALAHPDREALRSDTERLTFREAHALAGRWATALAARGVTDDVVVGIRLPRTAALVVMMLAVWRAGGSFVLLDPTQPEERQRVLLTDSGAALLVTDGEPPDGAPAAVTVAALDAAAATGATAPPPLPRADALAYAVFTSGSTGRPKGVLIEHRGLVVHATSHLAAMYGELDPGVRLNVAGLAAVSFDVFINQVLGMLVFGHRLLMIDDEERQDLPRLLARAEDPDTAVQILDCSTSQLDALVDSGLLERPYPPRLVIFGGESCSRRLWQALRAAPGLHAFNVYGATECTIESTAVHVRESADAVAGRATGGTRMYVLDGRRRLLPPTFVGEIYLGGSGVARGYTDPKLTAERFVADPFTDRPGGRMYRTGDRGRLRGDGELEFWGRVDDQVKIRGFRIEPGEVEVVLSRHVRVAQVAVVVREVAGSAQLVAYFVPEPGVSVGVEELRRFVGLSVPVHMVPSVFVAVGVMPLTVNGKLDRRALPEPVVVSGVERAARTPFEHVLCELFGEVLGQGRVGPEDNFFHLGGHSLLATRLVSRVQAVLGFRIPLRALFEAPTPAALATHLTQEGPERPVLEPAPRSERPPLSYAQQRLWFLNQLEGTGPAYNIPVALRLTGALDTTALSAALDDLVARHETLRTLFPAPHGTPHQRVVAAEEARPRLTEVRTTAAELPAAVAGAARHGFDLTSELPLRCHLFTVAPTEHVLLLVLHHIAADGWSMEPLARDLATAYRARLAGTAPDWAPLPVHYADYTVWQRRLLGESDDPDSLFHRQLDYWTGALDGLPAQLPLPYDHPRPARQSHRGGDIPFEIPAELHRALADVARRQNATLFMVLQGAFATLLHRLGAGEDIPLGTPVAGRTDEALDDLIGFFVNTLVLRTDLSGNVTFEELVRRVRETHLRAHQHQDLPFEQIVDRLNPDRSLAVHPLFQVMVVFTSEAGVRGGLDAMELPGLTVSEEPPDTGAVKFDLQLDLAETTDVDGAPAGIRGTLGYAADLFDETTAREITARLERVLAAVAADPAAPVADIDVLSPEEREAALAHPPAPYPLDLTLTMPRLFAQQVAATPHAPALVCGDTVLDYAELDRRARRLAARLVARGAGPERIVALALPRSPELVIAVLAVLISGAAYLPLDTAYPAERLGYLLDDAEPMCLLTDRTVLDRLPATAVPRLFVDEIVNGTGDGPGEGSGDGSGDDRFDGGGVPREPVQPHHLAYLIYTSGSTGRPKGVQTEHAQLTSYLLWCRHAYPGMRDSAVLHSSFAFDLTVNALLGTLALGGRVLVPVPGAAYPDGAAFGKVTPGHLEILDLDGELRSPSSELIVGGEALTGEQLVRWRARHPEVAILNEYGPTETTVGCVVHRIAPGDPLPSGAVPIGRPIAHTRTLVLDDRLRPVPRGVVGDLYITGAGLARGYLNQPQLTAEAFLPCPYEPSGGRMYRTGDRGRLRGDGELEFWGRVDDQVKIRGYRIEPGEVEVVLSRHVGVAQVAVVVREVAGSAQLVAYFVPEPGVSVGVEELRRFVGLSVPVHMVPSVFVAVGVMPLTVNGKLDRRALPEPVVVSGVVRAARTPFEHVLCGLFGEVLGRGRVGPEDNFFHLGGHSLLATRLVSRVQAVLGFRIPLRALFEAPTPAALATQLADGREDDSLDVLLPLRTGGSRPPLFCVAPASGLSWGYAGLLEHLDTDQPVYGLQVPGLTSSDELPRSLEELVRRCLDAIRAVCGNGPYQLLGWSAGGVLAHELAVRLREEGEDVALVALLDSYLTPPEQAALDEPALLRNFAEELGAPEGDVTRDTLRDWARRPEGPLASLSEAAVDRVIDAYLHTARLLAAHQPRVFPGDVQLFTAEADRAPASAPTDPAAPPDPLTCARPYVGGQLTAYGVDAHHVEMTAPAPLRRIAAHLAPLLSPGPDRPTR